MQKLFKKVMQRSNRRWGIGFSVAALLVCASFGQVSTGKVENRNQASKQSQDRATLAHVQAGLLGQPLAFEANRGQADANVKFLTRAQNFTVFMTPGETVLRGRNADVLRIKLLNANQSPKLVGESRQARITNYYVGDHSKWLTGVPNYGQVRYQEVYSGIDMVYHSDQRQLEYDFVVKPGADPNQIRVAFDGASKMSITEKGELELESATGTSVNHKPVVYQMVGSHRKMVNGEFALANNEVSFKVGEYDRTQPLIIDPSLQVLSFFGGTLNDEASGIAASAVQANATTAGIVFIGRSQSPTLGGKGKIGGAIDWDAFAVGLNGSTAGFPGAAGTTVLWTSYFGGSGDDAARGVAMDNQGNVYIAGYTNSSNFAAVGGVPASYDAFLIKLGASGGGIAGGTLYGGNLVDQATSIALDYSTFSTLANAPAITNPATDPQVTPNVVIGGVTSGGIGQAGSTTSMVGKTPDGKQTSFANCTAGTTGCGNTDGFVATFSSALALIHHTYIGGGGNDQVNGVAADIWGNIYATGFATPAVAPNFPIANGIAPTTTRASWDASLGPLNSAVPFVAKWACTTGSPAIGVPSPAFGVTNGVNSQMPICGGTNNLKTLSNSALFGGSANGGTFINPQQTVLGQNGITEAGFGIAVDQNGWGQTGVAGVTAGLAANGAGFPDIVPNSENGNNCSAGLAAGNNGFNSNRCAVSQTGTNGGFQPGLSGPHVYIVGATASRNFVNSLVVNASCRTAPFVSSTAVPALCPVPEVFGAGVIAAGTLPQRAFCDTVDGLGVCPTGAAGQIADLRIKAVTGGVNSGQTQGWLASFQFPAVTQAVVTPPLSSTTTVTTLNPPTIPNYIILQPATCPAPSTSAGNTNTVCIEGEVATAAHASTLTAATQAPPANFGCTGASCPDAFIGSWNAVAVDTEQQVYLIGQIGMGGATPSLFGTGNPNRLALEIERIAPYANTPGGTGLQPNFCPGGTDAPCAFPLEQFQSSANFGTDFLVDSGTTPGVGILNSSYGQLLPGAPPFPNPNQPGGLGNGIAVNPLREAFFVGTTTVTSSATPPLSTNSITSFSVSPIITFPFTAPLQATATAAVTGGAVVITLTNGGGGYSAVTLPNITLGGITGCTTSPLFTPTIVGGVITAINAGSAGVGCIGVAPTVTIDAPPPALSTGNPPGFQGNLGASGGVNASTAGGGGPEDVVYGAIQFFDAIASPTVVNFTATVNSFSSVTAPNGQTGANAKAVINYSNWQSQVLNIPPGCTISPNVPAIPGYPIGADGTRAAFTVTQINGTSSFLVTVNSSAAALGSVSVPGVITSVVTFTKQGTCTGTGVNQPPLESWDPLTLTLTVSAPMNLAAENTLNITSKLASGIVDQYFAGGTQLAAMQNVGVGIDVTTAGSGGPINFTAQIVPGQNWSGSVTGAVTMPTPTDIIYTAGSSGTGFPNSNGSTRVPLNVNTQVLAGLPVGTYTAYVMFAASPETPDLPTSGSTACGAATVPVASGTTSPACIPIIIQITPNVVAQTATLNFGASTTPQQTQVQVSNPTSAPYNFTAGYQATPVFGTALPAANVFFVGTGTTLIPASVGPPVAGTVPAGGVFSLPVQINPAGLTTGVYSGQILLSPNGLASGATAQTTVPIIVYVGPHTGEDTPSGNGLGLMLPTNVAPVGTGALPGAAPGSPGSYALTLSVPSGTGPSGSNQIPNPTLLQVTGLNNTSTTAFSVNSPTTSGLVAGSVTFTNVGQGFGGTLGGCGTTFGSLASLPGSPLGPPCVWSLWVDATTLNSTNTTAMAACGGGLGETGTISFSTGGFPGATLVVPLTVCVTDSPALTLGMPNTYPNPTFGPTAGTGFGNLLAQPSNLVPGFPQSIVEMVLAASGGGTLGATAAPINLLTQAGNSSQVCKILDIHTNGGVINSVTIAPMATQWLTVQSLANVQGGALFLGPPVGAPNSLQANSFNSFINGWGIFGIGQLGGPALPGTPPFAAGPGQITPAMQTFAICVNTDPVGNVSGTFSSTVTINGAGVGAITIPVNMVISNGTVAPPPVKTSQIGIFRPSTPVGAAAGVFALDANGNNTWDTPADALIAFGVAGDIPVAGDWDGTGVVRIGVYRPSNATWYLDMNNNGKWDPGTDLTFSFGIPSATCTPNTAAGLAACGDIPVVGDWGGTGTAKVGIFRSSTGTWYLDLNNNHAWDPGSDGVYSYGQPGDLPVVSNWSGTGTADQIGVFRAGTWYVDSNGDGVYEATDATYSYGQAGDIPVAGNWNGVGPKRIGVFRDLTGQWFLDINGDHAYSAADLTVNFGLPGDLPVVGGPWTIAH